MAFKPLAFHGVRQGLGAQGEGDVTKVRSVFFRLPGRSGQRPQQEASAAMARRPQPDLPPGGTGGLPSRFTLKPAAQSLRRPTREGSARRALPRRGFRLRSPRDSPESSATLIGIVSATRQEREFCHEGGPGFLRSPTCGWEAARPSRPILRDPHPARIHPPSRFHS